MAQSTIEKISKYLPGAFNEDEIQKIIRSSSKLDIKHPGVYRGLIVRSESIPVNLEFVRKNYNKIAIDWKELQRCIDPWKQDQIDSYLTTVLYGMEKKDLFQLIELETQIEWLHSKLEENLPENDKEMFQYCLQYFTGWKNTGAKYLCIDGQHRLFYLHKFLTSQITFNVIGENEKQWIVENRPVQMSDTLFENYPQEVQNFILDIELQTTVYSNAPLKIFSMIFSSSNKGKAIHPHEDRMILNSTEWCSYLKDEILEDPHRDFLGNNISFKSPSFIQKGDTHFVTKMFPWWCLQKPKSLLSVVEPYNFSDKETDFLFETQSLPKGYVNEFSKIWKDLVICLYNGEPKTKLAISTLANLFYYIAKFTYFGIADKKFSIEVPDDFFTHFLKKEEERKDRTEYAKDADGNDLKNGEGLKVEDIDGYKRKCKTQTHNNYKVRIKEMDKDIFNDFQELVNMGIIKENGSRKSSLSQYEVAKHNSFKDGKGNDISDKDLFSKKGKTLEINEINPVSNSGHRELDNTNLLTPKDNKAEYHTKQKFK